MAVSAYGDSITDGYGASDPSKSYVGLIAANTGWNIANLSEVGNGMVVFAYKMMSRFVSPGDTFIALVGYNDMRQWGTSAAGQTTYRDALLAGMLWLTIPNDHKISAYSNLVGRHGTANGGVGNWQSGSLFNCPLLHTFTADVDDYLTVTLKGTAIYIGFVYRTGIGGGIFQVTVDGVDYGIKDEMAGLINLGNYQYWPGAIRIGGLTPGPHNVVVTATDLTAGNVTISWFASNDPLPKSPAPRVYMGNCLRMTPTGYTEYVNYGQGSDTAVTQFNLINATIAQNLASDGWNLFYIDACSYYDPNNGDVGPDNAHPNDQGYEHISIPFIEIANA